MKKLELVYGGTMFLFLLGIASLTYYIGILGLLYWPLVIWSVMSMIGITSVYKMVTCEESVRIPLDVVMIDNKIDMWRGKLCEAQHNDDLEEESQAMIQIDAYQDIRVLHGLKPLPRVL